MKTKLSVIALMIYLTVPAQTDSTLIDPAIYQVVDSLNKLARSGDYENTLKFANYLLEQGDTLDIYTANVIAQIYSSQEMPKKAIQTLELTSLVGATYAEKLKAQISKLESRQIVSVRSDQEDKEHRQE